MSFSELLKQCRKKQGISQAELASKLGVTQQAVGKEDFHEKGRNHKSHLQLCAWLYFLTLFPTLEVYSAWNRP
ncbi:transcriptional regulator%2C y4mF family [uncultured Clostridium sp.]|nr:transcriptional regulator%2C y4mF family [uncultured Clostridium sp.]